MAAISAASASSPTSRRRAKRMRECGSVSIPQEAFIAALRMGDDA
jgi:translation elongation factor EF-4